MRTYSFKDVKGAVVSPLLIGNRTVTCAEARELSLKVGVRVFWRPKGIEYWLTPELDTAEVLED